MPVDILLTGELGVGKTTLLRGLARGLGIHEPVVSPTFAIEQRYITPLGAELLHLDLYRLSPHQAEKLMEESADHTGIRCIEWPERLPNEIEGPRLQIRITEDGDGRVLSIDFRDIPLPTDVHIEQWRRDVLLPDRIIIHCEAVATVCRTLATALHERGTIVRTEALSRAAQLHDLLRFVDFHGQSMEEVTPTQRSRWEALRTRYAGQSHEEACATFLQEHGYAALGHIVSAHGARSPLSPQHTTEQQLLYYADKRVALDRIVTVEKRAQEFLTRNGPEVTPIVDVMRRNALELERTLFPDGPPSL
jgi:tRNA threonylcarbamoyladenosine biosynthesis protein TsaE